MTAPAETRTDTVPLKAAVLTTTVPTPIAGYITGDTRSHLLEFHGASPPQAESPSYWSVACWRTRAGGGRSSSYWRR